MESLTLNMSREVPRPIPKVSIILPHLNRFQLADMSNLFRKKILSQQIIATVNVITYESRCYTLFPKNAQKGLFSLMYSCYLTRHTGVWLSAANTACSYAFVAVV